MVLLAIWVALLATFSMALSEIDLELKINVTLNNKTTSKSTAIPLFELDPDFSTLDSATVAEIAKADLTCNPGGYTQADIRGVKAGIRELDKMDGFRSLEGKHCEWAACGMSAAIWWCNTGNEPKSISHRNVGDKANMIVNGCPWNVRDLHDVVAGIRQVVGDWRVIVKEDKNIC
ncbi:hypothetical protein BJY00DRAFT_318803 [Aspergillus carlsbadensis]|nr:hypothetical protein BJY00DRAFT_318803 [Aspergillus carlsbadensis]